MNYFSILNLPLKANLCLKSLELAYVNAQIAQFQNNNQQLLNESYQHLGNNIKRIQHIFNILNYQLDEITDNKILLEFFEINEEVADASDKKELIAIADHLNQEIVTIMDKIDQLLEKNSHQTAYLLFMRMKYIDRILDNIDKRGQNL